MRFIRFIAVVAVLGLAAQAAETPVPRVPGLDEPYLGWIPVQPAAAGGKLQIDMRRFCNLGPGHRLEAEVPVEGVTLSIHPAASARGLYRSAVRIVDAGNRTLREGVLEWAVSPRTGHRFVVPASATTGSRVTVAGSFNGWNTGSHPLERMPDGSFELFVTAPPGPLEYKFLFDGQWTNDPGNPARAPNGNSIVTVVGPAGEAPVVFAAEATADEVVFRIDGGPLATVSVVAQFADGSSRSLEVPQVEDGRLRVPVSGLPAGSWVRVTVADVEGRCSAPVRVRAAGDGGFQWQDGILYYAFTDRFSNGDPGNDAPVPDPKVLPPANYFGGDFDGIRQRIEDGTFQKLGINILWLAPLNQNPEWSWQEFQTPYRHYTGYHGYWPVSSTEVEKRFGGEAALEALIEAAHAAGLKIVADLVLRHVHVDHPLWSEHRDWFGSLTLPDGRKNLRLWDEQQFTTWFEEWLPGFDFDNPEAVHFLIGNGVEWARRFNLDGFRLDAVKHIPPAFWHTFRAGMRAAVPDTRKPPMYFVGETFMDRAGIMSFVGPAMLDAQFDFPLYDTLIAVFAQGSAGFGALEESLRASETIYGKETPMSPLLGNHDKPRFLAYADGDLVGLDHAGEIEAGWSNPPRVDDPSAYDELRMAWSFLMAIDGVPMVYYGDEVGLTGAGDPDNRRMMPEEAALDDQQRAVREHFEKVSAIRRAHPALRYGSRRAAVVADDHYAFVRRHLGDAVAVAWNRAAAPATLRLKVAPEMRDGPAVEMLTGQPLEIRNGEVEITMPPRSSAFFKQR